MNIGYIAHAIDSNSCDHELLTLSIDVPTRDIPQGMEYRYKPPRKQFLTHKLKDKNTKKAYQTALTKKSETIMKQMKALRDSHQSGHISKQTLANDINKIFTSYVQEAAESHLGEVHPMVPIRHEHEHGTELDNTQWRMELSQTAWSTTRRLDHIRGRRSSKLS